MDQYGKVEELERLRDRPSVDLAPAVATATAPPLVSVEKVDSIAVTVQELASGAGGLNRRQATLENRCVCACEREVAWCALGRTRRMTSVVHTRVRLPDIDLCIFLYMFRASTTNVLNNRLL